MHLSGDGAVSVVQLVPHVVTALVWPLTHVYSFWLRLESPRNPFWVS